MNLFDNDCNKVLSLDTYLFLNGLANVRVINVLSTFDFNATEIRSILFILCIKNK